MEECPLYPFNLFCTNSFHAPQAPNKKCIHISTNCLSCKILPIRLSTIASILFRRYSLKAQMITKAYNEPNPKVTSIFFQMMCKKKGVT
jgi:hypothetical protein